MKIAVFLDRDGTVNEEVNYLSDPDQLRLIAGAAEGIKRLNGAGLKVVLVTNQSGIARGYFSEAVLHQIHERLRLLLAREGARIDAVYYCPHHPSAGNSPYTVDCDCRKPGTGLIDRASRDLGIDVKNSFVVGDKWSDIELAQRAGSRSILVSTGYAADDPGNKRPEHVGEPDLIAHSLAEAAEWILREVGGGKR